MNKTSIEWVKNPDGTQGYTWNPITGCNNQIDGMCQGGNFPCYAYRLANGRLKARYLANKNTATKNYDEDSYPFYPRFWRERLDDIEIPPKKRDWQKPRGIFVCDMGDLFGDWLPTEWVSLVFYMMSLNPQHRFYLLTKQPQNLIKWSPFPNNCWVGVSVCNDKMLDVAVDKLEDIEAKNKFISFEPLLKRLTLSLDYAFYYSGINWVIIGAQTKPTVMPKIEWVEEICHAATHANIPVFIKNNLKPLYKAKYGVDAVRQELPE